MPVASVSIPYSTAWV